MDASELGDAMEVIPAASIVRVDCPQRAAAIGRRLANSPSLLLSPLGDTSDAEEIAAALLRGDLALVRRSPPELDDYDGTAGRPLRDLAATGS